MPENNNNADQHDQFNISVWALKNQVLVLYFILLATLAGALAYTQLGQSEDPPFTFKVMLVRTTWPGASAIEVEQQITDKIEKKLQEITPLEFTSSYSRPGISMIFIRIRDDAFSDTIPEYWYQIRKKIGDIKHTLPKNIQSLTFNDEFSDVYGTMYALTGDGFDNFALKQQADMIRHELLKTEDVAKVDFFGEQKQKVFIEASNTKLASLGITLNDLAGMIRFQNSVVASGTYESPKERIRLAITGRYLTLEELKNTHININGDDIKLRDIAEIYRGYEDPPVNTVRYSGQDALFLGVSMREGGDIIALGRALDERIATIKQQLPVGVELHTITSQAKIVSNSVQDFVKALVEALVIVLGMSLLSLGARTGLVVAITIPIVLAATFLMMNYFDIGLHKISLGALILSLGLLVDDAIIAVEMMSSKMEQGWDRIKAASFTFTSTAKPMLTGTLVTVAGFLPIATALSSTGEYTRSIFQVTAISLSISWIAAVVVVPYLGYHILPNYNKQPAESGFMHWLKTKLNLNSEHHHHDIYNTPFYRRYRATVTWCVKYKKTVILLTILLFASALLVFGQVQQQFFPDSTRSEVVVDLRLTESASYEASNTEVKKLEQWLKQWNDENKGIDNVAAYIGSGAPRYYLPLDIQLPHRAFAQLVISTNSLEDREHLRTDLLRLFEQDFPTLRASVIRLENGPPVGFPVQFRVDGRDLPKAREIANQIAAVMRENPNLTNTQLGWEEPSKVVKIQIDQSKARLLGISSVDVANLLNGTMSELYISDFREGEEKIDIVARSVATERDKLSTLKNLSIATAKGDTIPLSQIASLSYEFEEGVIWHRNRIPSISVRAHLKGSMQAPVVSAQVEEKIADIKANLPYGITVETGGAVEESAKGSASVAKGAPLFLAVVVTLLILQLNSFSKVFLVMLTAPLGFIGVAFALLLFNQPFGFVAMLGTIALSGMIMRNSVILVDQIDQDKADGMADWQAVVESSVRRFRPITLTAATAILAMIPLTRSVFFGPMAVAIMGGLAVATLLTVLFLPSLYAAWYRIKVPKDV